MFAFAVPGKPLKQASHKQAGIDMKAFLRIAPLLSLFATPAIAAHDWSQARQVTVVTSNYRFTPKKLVFKRGIAYRLHLQNQGSEMHEFSAPAFFRSVEIRDPGVLNSDKTEIDLQPGESKNLEFVPQRAGRFRLVCPDHDWAGMTGHITVE